MKCVYIKGVVFLSNHAEAILRFSIVHGFSRILDSVIVNEYPKSGGTWVGQMLSDALEIPFPRNCMPRLERSIMHGHFLSPWGMKNVLVVWRDGRDVMVSWYYHCLFKNEHFNSPLVDKVISDLNFKDPENISENLPKFLEYSFTRQVSPKFTWSDFVRKWHNRKGIINVKYEALRTDTSKELIRICNELAGIEIGNERANEISDHFSFARQSGRKPGEEAKSSFMRKGIVGDWQNQFSQEAREIFNQYAGPELILLGYESDDSWVNAESIKWG